MFITYTKAVERAGTDLGIQLRDSILAHPLDSGHNPWSEVPIRIVAEALAAIFLKAVPETRQDLFDRVVRFAGDRAVYKDLERKTWRREFGNRWSKEDIFESYRKERRLSLNLVLDEQVEPEDESQPTSKRQSGSVPPDSILIDGVKYVLANQTTEARPEGWSL